MQPPPTTARPPYATTGAAATATGATATTGRQAAIKTTVPQDLTFLDGPTHVPLQALRTHARVATCSPTPHDREHELHALHRVQYAGLIGVPQVRDCVAGPVQGLPQELPR